MGERAWTLETARALLGEVRQRTEVAVTATAGLETRPGHADDAVVRENREKVEAFVGRWLREMEALGVEARGPWHVDFETGAGAYCWQWPESSLDHFHAAGSELATRTRIQ